MLQCHIFLHCRRPTSIQKNVTQVTQVLIIEILATFFAATSMPWCFRTYLMWRRWASLASEIKCLDAKFADSSDRPLPTRFIVCILAKLFSISILKVLLLKHALRMFWQLPPSNKLLGSWTKREKGIPNVMSLQQSWRLNTQLAKSSFSSVGTLVFRSLAKHHGKPAGNKSVLQLQLEATMEFVLWWLRRFYSSTGLVGQGFKLYLHYLHLFTERYTDLIESIVRNMKYKYISISHYLI